MKKLSKLEETMALHIRAVGLPEPDSEYRFHPKRRWRFDFAWPDLMIAVECEGGTYTNGRHVRGSGFERDCEKYNAATELDWNILRFTKKQIDNGYAIDLVERMVKRFIERQK